MDRVCGSIVMPDPGGGFGGYHSNVPGVCRGTPNSVMFFTCSKLSIKPAWTSLATKSFLGEVTAKCPSLAAIHPESVRSTEPLFKRSIVIVRTTLIPQG